ncbi:MAG: type II toxin-antitoxin system PemK/MazF family toxin [Planctomycetia bacterium]|nr:type II toxin-antitoxin system PemK/MazF family toxin [Planctomycetia bacterium]
MVILEFPFVQGGRGKNRPALVVQNDRDNGRLTNTIVAMISGNLRHAAEVTQLLVEPRTTSGKASGLHGPSVVKCGNLFTVAQQDVMRVIGHLPDDLMIKVDECLLAALALRSTGPAG